MHLEQLCRRGLALAGRLRLCAVCLLTGGSDACSRHTRSPWLGVCSFLLHAEPNNNAELWSSVWDDSKESGTCTGLEQGQWMRLATERRTQYDPDVSAAVQCNAVQCSACLPNANKSIQTGRP